MQKQQVAEYELYKRIKLLGEGAFGKAYLVECLTNQSLWVTKYMDLNSMATKEKDETIKEAKILELLNHPNIVKFKEVYQTKKGKLCIVMEYADGGDLAKRIKDAKNKLFTELQILDWFTQICLALKHVHERKILHRDLKGQNIFLTKDDRVKLGDFGIAKVLGRTVEKAKTMVGTPYYLSPEIIESKPYSFKSDIWSLGAVLYEMCSLKPPFNADSLHFLALKIVRGQYSPIPDLYSREMKNLVNMMLQVDVNRRPTIQEILKQPIILNRIKEFLSESTRRNEFSHTMLHNKVFKPESGFSNIKQVINELPCPPSLLPQKKSEAPLEKKPEAQVQQKQQQQQTPQQKPPQQISPQQIFPFKPPVIAIATPQPRPDTRNGYLQKPPQLQAQQIIQQTPQRGSTPQKLQQQQQQPQQQQQQLQQQQQSPYQQQQQQQMKKPSIPSFKPPQPIINQGGGQLIVNPVYEKKVSHQPRPSLQQNKAPSSIKKPQIVDEAQKKKEEEERLRYQKLKQEKDVKRKDEEKKKRDHEKQIVEQKQNEKAEQVNKREEDRKFMREDLARKRQKKGVDQYEYVEEQKEPQKKQQEEELDEYNSDQEEQSTQKLEDEPDLQEYISDYEEDEQQVYSSPNIQQQIQEDPINQALELAQEDLYIKDLLELIANANNAVKNLPFAVDQNFFDNKSQLLERPMTNRDDDVRELSFKNKDKHSYLDEKQLRELSKEEDESLIYLNNNAQKECLRLTLVDVLGEELFEKSCKILKEQIEKFDLEQIEQKHQSSNYKSLFPFLDEIHIKRYLPLLFSYIVE